MTKKLIYADDAIKALTGWVSEPTDEDIKYVINNITAIDAVSKVLFDQIKCERDIAISQLEDLGICFGEKIDGVYLTKEEYEKLVEYKYMYEDLCR